jgi:hypothetical protein
MTVKPTPRPAHLAHGRWLGDFEPLSAFEKKLVRCCATGEVCAPDGWDGKRPEADEATDANTVRAELIRFLALGGDKLNPVHEEGVVLAGAWIRSELSLHQAHATTRLVLLKCHFEQTPVFSSLKIPQLALDGSAATGLRATSMTIAGDMYLREFVANGEVRVAGTRVDGNFECRDGQFSNRNGDALDADLVKVSGSIFFDGITADGVVRLIGAQIGGSLSCRNAHFNNPSHHAIMADRMLLSGSAFFEDATVNGGVSLSAAKIGTLIDDSCFWRAGLHFLDGFQYNQIVGPTEAEARINWLKNQLPNHLANDFRPQPWEQLVKVLREMGHPYEAAEIAMAKQRALRAAGKINGIMRKPLHWLFGKIAGYGHRPIWTVQWMAVVWLLAAFFFHVGASYGYLGPTTPLLNSPALSKEIDKKCGHRFETPAKQIWTKCAAMPPEYTTFQPLIYSLDLILPLVDLQQERDWAPIVEDPPGNNLPYGVFLRWLMWFEILFGWMASLVLVAVLGRLVEKD